SPERSPSLSTRSLVAKVGSTPGSPLPPGSPGPGASVEVPVKASLFRVPRTKTCVCAASSQLGRERSRLLKEERQVLLRGQRLAQREDGVDEMDSRLASDEQELAERRQQFVHGEVAV
ncbi:unnamed protein product, partial [Polarella glacialis]